MTTLDLALMRWSVVCQRWDGIAKGFRPQLGPFLAGWFSNGIGICSIPEVNVNYRESFRCGWEEAEYFKNSEG